MDEYIIRNEEKSPSIPAKISALMIVTSVTELFVKSEKFYYPVFVVLLFIYFLKHQKGRVKANFSWLMLFFGLYAFFSTLWSPLTTSINSAFTKVVVLLFLWLQLQFDYSEEDYRLIRSAFIIQALFFLVVVALFGVSLGEGRLWILRGNVGADPNSLVVWTLIPIIISFEVGMDKETKPCLRIGAFILIALLFRIVLQCASRAGFFSSAIGVSCCILYALRYNIRRKPIVAIMIIIVTVAVAVYIYQHLPPVIILRLQYSDASNLGGRSTTWKVLLDLLKRSPLNCVFGFGESGSIAYISKVAHNMYVEILFNQGIVGVGMIVVYMFYAFKNIIHKDIYATIAFMSVAIMSATLSEFSSRGVMLAFFLAGANWFASDANNV